MNDTDKIKELLGTISFKLSLIVLILATALGIVFGLMLTKAHAATIAYGTPPAVASEITQDLKGLPNIPYTIEVSNGPILEMGVLCDGVTWINDKTITVNAYQSKEDFDYTLYYELNHAIRGDADEPSSEAFATKMMALRGESVTPWTVTAEQQAVEDSWNLNAKK